MLFIIMGKQTCAVITCGKTKDDDVSLHNVPKGDEATHWNAFINAANSRFLEVWKPTKHMYVCSGHFSASCVNPTNLGRQRITHGHTPHCSSEETTKSMTCVACSQAAADAVTAQYELELELSTDHSLNIAVVQKENELVGLDHEIKDLKYQIKLCQGKVDRREESKKRKIIEIDDLRAQIKSMKKMKPSKASVKSQTELTLINSEKSSFLRLFEELSSILSKGKSYNDYVKEFAFRLHYISPKAYDFMRNELQSLLPHPGSIGRWIKPIISFPGLFPSALSYIQQEGGGILYNIVIDEMHIRKKIVFDGTRMHGYVDYGGLISTAPDQNVEATTAMFIMATQVNGKKAIPLGYVLTNKLTAAQTAEIVNNSLIAISNLGVRVTSITFDGLASNMKSMEILGANLNVFSSDFSPWVINPVTEKKVYVILDPSHMMKLLRNAFKSCKEFYDAKGRKISWHYIELLIQLQRENGLRLANKLTIRHSKFDTQKMKTRLCVQVLSNSVAVALDVCRKLEINGFEETEATADFLRTFDRLFDMLNARCGRKGYKSPLSTSGKPFWSPFFDECKEFLRGLKYRDKNGDLTPLLNSRKSTFSKGLLITISSIQGLMNDVVADKSSGLRYLSTYKLSQDHIEMFFGKVRSRFGCNNNPSSYELMSALKTLLCAKLNPVIGGNCIPQDDTTQPVCPIGNLRSLTDMSQLEQREIENTEDIEFPSFETMSLFVNNVVVYIAGYVSRKLCATLECPSCIAALISSTCVNSEEHVLINEKNNGGLITPSTDVTTICKLTESCIRSYKAGGVKLLNAQKITHQVYLDCIERKTFAAFEHERTPLSTENHLASLIKGIIQTYTKIRLYYIAKETTLEISPTTLRSNCTKIVHFSGN